MGENTAIEWADHSWNPWIGCTMVSPGCANCYAMTLMDLRYGQVKWGVGQPRMHTGKSYWNLPHRWNKAAERAGTRPKVFCASLSDWLDEEVPAEWLAALLLEIHATPHLDWLLLTKRPQNFQSRLNAAYSAPGMGSGKPETDWIWHWANGHGCIPDNVWIGTSVEDQPRAEERIPHLLNIPAKVRFVSCEPLLGPVRLDGVNPLRSRHSPPTINALTGETFWPDNDVELNGPRIHWVIAGGESGPGARPMHQAWARSLRNQCATANVPFFFKQWGSHDQQGTPMAKKVSGRLLDGVEHLASPRI